MPRTGPLPVERLRDDFGRWLADRHFDRGVKFYTQEQWAARGEQLCLDAAITVLIEESPLFALLNTYWEDFPGDPQSALADLEDFLESRGYWYDLGFTWSLHLYPVEALDPVPSTPPGAN